MNNNKKEEKELLESCCNEAWIDVNEVLQLLEIEDQYATKERRTWIIEKLKDTINEFDD